MSIEIASRVGPSGIDIAYERFGDPSAPTVLLVMGMGTQLIGWPDGLCKALVQQGLHVVRFDNRDAGQSTHFAGRPDFLAATRGDFATAVYTLSDMAADTAGLLDALGMGAAHVVGASLGGFVAQTLAIEHPARVRSLTSIMSTTGAPDVGQLHAEARVIFSWPRPTTREEAMERAVRTMALLGSPGFPHDDAVIAQMAGRAWDRDHDPDAIVRQAVATLASGDRTEKLRALSLPTIVIHGEDDRMCDVSGGRATAAAIPGAELITIPGMGHDLPRAVWPTITDAIARLARRS